MPKFTVGRAVAVFSSLAACALLPACRGHEEGRNAPADSTQAATTNTGTTAVLHLTGMLLVAPSAQAGEVANVLIPTTMPNHQAILAIPMQPDNADATTLCMDPAMVKQDGICHVDLKKWTVTRFLGGGDPPPSGAELPAGLLDATQLAGAQYKARVNKAARVTLVAGWAGPTPCSLANWTYKGVGESAAHRAALVNVLDWEIHNPTNLTIEFRNVADIRTVPLQPEGGRIDMVLANVHDDDVKHIPPNPGPATVATGDPKHFQYVYDLLEDAQGQKPQPATTHRPTPEAPKPVTARACPIAVTSTTTKRADEVNAAGTAACMVATGVGG